MATLTLPSPTIPTAREAAGRPPVMGGEAWIMPVEPGRPAWITASAPQIRVVDRRPLKRASA